MKILITAPVCEDEEIFRLYLKSLNNLVVSDCIEIDKFFVLHNCEKLKKYLKRKEYFIYNTKAKYKKDETTHYWEDENLSEVAFIKNGIIKKAIAENYDYVFWVDSDILLHPNTLYHLLTQEKDIIGNIFWTKWKPNEIAMPNCWDFDGYGFKDFNKYKQNGVFETGMTGACILVNTEVYKITNYLPIRNLSLKGEDRHFCIRAAVNGYEIFISTLMPAFHIYRKTDLQKGVEWLNAKINNSTTG